MFSPLILHRVAHWLHRKGIRRIPGLIQRINYGFTGCDIPPQVVVGRNVRFQHYGSGVVLHQIVVIEDDVWIMPHVVIGQNVGGHGAVRAAFNHITIRRGAMIGAGAKIIASDVLEIGEGAAVGANAVVLTSVPPRMLAVGVPARIIQPPASLSPVPATQPATAAR